MKIHIEVEVRVDDAAWGEAPGSELARVMREFATAVDGGAPRDIIRNAPNTLRDHAGSVCGRVWATGCWGAET